MSAYYNENNPYCAQWLRNLIKDGLIADGVVDERSIEEVAASDLAGFTQCHFFAGIGGWSYALRLARFDNLVCWTGSCPCQPFSVAGKKLRNEDERHLFPIWRRLIEQCRPPIVFGEQVSGTAAAGWADDVSDRLEQLGYSFGAAVLPAASVGAPHLRERLYWVGIYNWKVEHSVRDGLYGRVSRGEDSQRKVVDRQVGCNGSALHEEGVTGWETCDFAECKDGRLRPFERESFPLAYGVPPTMEQLRAYGNAIVPQVAARFIDAVADCCNLPVDKDLP